jgi:hypothetical protein
MDSKILHKKAGVFKIIQALGFYERINLLYSNKIEGFYGKFILYAE